MAARHPKAVDPAWLERAALHYLERYASSADNLRRVLQRKAKRRVFGGEETVPDELNAWIAALLEKLARLKLLDDQAYAETRLRRQLAEGKSLGSIKRGMAAKGVGETALKNAFARMEAEREAPLSDWPAALAYARKRRLGPYRADPEQRKAMRQKDMAALARRGFSQDVARRILAAEDINALESFQDE